MFYLARLLLVNLEREEHSCINLTCAGNFSAVVWSRIKRFLKILLRWLWSENLAADAISPGDISVVKICSCLARDDVESLRCNHKKRIRTWDCMLFVPRRTKQLVTANL